MTFMNTQVTRGAGTIVVTTTGMGTEVGHISGMLRRRPRSKRRRSRSSWRVLTNQILVIAGVALSSRSRSGSRGARPSQVLFLTAVAFAVSAIPTGLPAVVTAVLSDGTSDARRGRRDRQAPALGGDPRLDVGHQLRQDRHADAQPDDRGPDGDRRPPLRDLRRGLFARTARSRTWRARRTSRSTPICCRWRSARTRSSKTAP